MNDEDLQVLLENLNLSGTEMPVHQNRLRNSLLGYGEDQLSIRPSLWLDVKGFFERVFNTRRFALIGSGAVLATAAVFGFVLLNSQNSSIARAEGLINHSIETMQSLTPEAKAQFEREFGADPIDFLEQAKQSKDLAIITKVEYQAEWLRHGSMGDFSVGNESHHFALTVNKYLRYTNPSRQTVLLGLLDNDALVYAVIFVSEHRTNIRLGSIENLG